MTYISFIVHMTKKCFENLKMDGVTDLFTSTIIFNLVGCYTTKCRKPCNSSQAQAIHKDVYVVALFTSDTSSLTRSTPLSPSSLVI